MSLRAPNRHQRPRLSRGESWPDAAVRCTSSSRCQLAREPSRANTDINPNRIRNKNRNSPGNDSLNSSIFFLATPAMPSPAPKSMACTSSWSTEPRKNGGAAWGGDRRWERHDYRLLNAIPSPRKQTRTDETTGSIRINGHENAIRSMRLRAATNASASAVSTVASPAENATRRPSPNARRCTARAVSNTTRAAGQGTRPPEMPRARRSRSVCADARLACV